MMGLNLPPIEDIDVEDLLALPEGYRYELHEGNLVIMTPSTFWIVDQAPGRPDDDALVLVHTLLPSVRKPTYAGVRELLLSELEAEYRAGEES